MGELIPPNPKQFILTLGAKMSQKALYEEVIEEIGTQTLARFGLNIFSLNTYAAYGNSVLATSDVMRAYERHKNNPQYHGQMFEEIDIGQTNIKEGLFSTGNQAYTTDTLNDIRKIQGMLKENKKIENLQVQDREKFEYIMSNYKYEVENFDFSKGDLNHLARTNHNTTDTVLIDKNGNVIKTAQLKAIQDTKGLLKDRYLEGEFAVDELRMPLDDYKRHKGNLEEMIKNGEGSSDPKKIEQARKAKIALEKLNAGNVTNRLMCENPKTTAFLTQSVVASGHIVQAGASDAIVVALSTFANGVIWELKDMFDSSSVSHVSIMDRVKRLINKVIEAFKKTFVRGASFGAIDVAIGILGQIFKSISGSLRQLWKQIRSSFKSIYNAIYSYITGEIKSTKEMLSVIIKALFSSVWIIATLGLEKKLEVEFSFIFASMPFLASFLASSFSIVIGAFAVVVTSRSVDAVLDALFGVFSARDKAKMRKEEIADLIASSLPAIMEEEERLYQIVEETHRKRLQSIESSFEDYQKAYSQCDEQSIYNALNNICGLWGEELKVKNMEDVQNILENPNRSGKLKW